MKLRKTFPQVIKNFSLLLIKSWM